LTVKEKIADRRGWVGEGDLIAIHRAGSPVRGCTAEGGGATFIICPVACVSGSLVFRMVIVIAMLKRAMPVIEIT